MKKWVLILFGFVLFNGCKKEKEPLTGNFLPLVGEWKYIGRLIYEGAQQYIEPYGIEHSIIFKEEGIYEVMYSDNKKEKGRIVSTSEDKYNQYISLVANKNFTSKIFIKDSYNVDFYSTTPEKLRLSGKFKICNDEEELLLIYERK